MVNIRQLAFLSISIKIFDYDNNISVVEIAEMGYTLVEVIIMTENKKKDTNEKTATDNQWTSTGIDPHDQRERRDGPGGENNK